MRASFLVFFTIFSAFSFNSFSQNLYWILLKDKEDKPFDALSYFDVKAIERRIVNELPLYDHTDLPVNDKYVDQISKNCSKVYYASRWLNAVAVESDKIENIIALPFVVGYVQVESNFNTCSSSEKYLKDLSKEELKMLLNQTERMGASDFKKANITGKGIRIAIFDAGFPGVDKNEVFEHIRKRNGIILTYDFVKGKEFVYGYSSHGASVLSCIAGKINDTLNIGLATDAEFLLARTEHAQKEPFSEEVNWMKAMEWADKNGAQIINSSLGYTAQRYFTTQMNGKTSLVAKAANMAAAKGILVVNAAGNDGDGEWKTLGTPADADSVLTVGGVDPETDYHTSFSSYGPNQRKILKPNVCAYGHVIAASPKSLTKTQGTSFSSPLVAGFAACALQSLGKVKWAELFKAIEESGHLYPYFDYAHGYGIPQAAGILKSNETITEPTFKFVERTDYIKIFAADTLAKQNAKYNLMYYSIKNAVNTIDSYYVIDVKKEEVKEINLKDIPEGGSVSVWYKGYSSTYIKK